MTHDVRKPMLTDADITTTRRPQGRRTFLGLMAAGGVSATLVPRMAAAQARDGDTGAWVDSANCPRGPAGSGTSGTDADSGAISDPTGRGRGAPRC